MKSRNYCFSFALSSCSAIIIAAFGFMATAPNVRAQAASQTTPSTENVPKNITLDDAIHAAIARNTTVRTAHNAERSSDIEVTRSKDNMWMPTASATGSWGYEYSLVPQSQRQYYTEQAVQAGDSIAFAPELISTPASSQSLSYNVSATENLFNGGADVARISAAEASFGAAKNQFTWTRQETAFNVTSDYLNVLRTDELVGAADSTLAEALAQYSLIKGQYDAGVVPIAQVYQQEAVVGQDSLGLIQAVNTYENAETALLLILNIPPNEYENYTFSAAGIDTSTTDALRKASDTSISADRFNPAIDTRPDIIAQQENIKASADQVDETRAALYPKLNASVGVGGSGDNSDLTKIQMANAFNLGLTLSVPIFDAMQNRLAIDEQEIAVENQQITLEQDVQQARSDATNAVINLQSAKEAIIASDAALVSAQEGLRLAEEQLNVGSGTEVAVIVAEAALETARTNRVNAKYNWVLAQKQLDYTLGKWNY
jgi:outer membrane protein